MQCQERSLSEAASTTIDEVMFQNDGTKIQYHSDPFCIEETETLVWE